MLESDFDSEYGHDLSELMHVKSWRWFTVRLAGLFAADTRIHRLFRPSDEGDPE